MTSIPFAAPGRGSSMTSLEDSPVELRCAVAVVRGDAVLLVQRPDRGDWVLPGGRPHPHEGLASCARRETREETGVDVFPNRCALVLEVNDPVTRHRVVEVVFIAEEFDTASRLAGEPGRQPEWVRWDGRNNRSRAVCICEVLHVRVQTEVVDNQRVQPEPLGRRRAGVHRNTERPQVADGLTVFVGHQTVSVLHQPGSGVRRQPLPPGVEHAPAFPQLCGIPRPQPPPSRVGGSRPVRLDDQA